MFATKSPPSAGSGNLNLLGVPGIADVPSMTDMDGVEDMRGVGCMFCEAMVKLVCGRWVDHGRRCRSVEAVAENSTSETAPYLLSP